MIGDSLGRAQRAYIRSLQSVHSGWVLVESRARTICRNDEVVIFRRGNLLYIIPRNLSQSDMSKKRVEDLAWEATLIMNLLK